MQLYAVDMQRHNSMLTVRELYSSRTEQPSLPSDSDSFLKVSD